MKKKIWRKIWPSENYDFAFYCWRALPLRMHCGPYSYIHLLRARARQRNIMERDSRGLYSRKFPTYRYISLFQPTWKKMPLFFCPMVRVQRQATWEITLKQKQKLWNGKEESEKYVENFSPFHSFGHTGILCAPFFMLCVNIILPKFMSFIFVFEIIFKRQTQHQLKCYRLVKASSHCTMRAMSPCAMVNVCWPAFEFLKTLAFE